MKISSLPFTQNFSQGWWKRRAGRLSSYTSGAKKLNLISSPLFLCIHALRLIKYHLSLSSRTTSAQCIEQHKFICGLTLWRGHQIQGMTNGGSSEGLCRRRRLRLLWSIKGQDTITLPFFRIHFSILLKWGGKFMSIYESCCHAHEPRRFLFNILFSHEKCSFMIWT